MPNWVFNTLTIQGSKEQVDYIKNKLNEPFTQIQDKWDNEKMEQIKDVKVYYDNPVISFWNIIKPTDLEAYNTAADQNGLLEPLNWYNWNVNNWGTKWDIGVSNDEQYPETELIEYKSDGEDNWVIYRFNTAWSPPTQAMINLSKLVPTCVITLEYQEEGGWGGDAEFINGEITVDNYYEWQCRECQYEADETPYCENCEHDMCPECSYGEPDYDLWEKCPTHSVVLDLERKAEV